MARENKIPFGEKDGRMVTIDQVPSGKACGCICANCKAPLIARKGKLKTDHFAHAPGVEACSGGMQTAMHRMAIQIIEEKKRILLPDYYKQSEKQDLSGMIHTGALIEILGTMVELDEVKKEYFCHGRRVDATGFLKDRILHIEVMVTHEVDDEKKQIFKDKREAMMEIDLSNLDRNIIMKPDEFEREVLENQYNRYWLVHPKGDQQYLEAKRKLREYVEKRNIPIKKAKKKAEEEQRKRREEQARYDKAREEARKPYEKELTLLRSAMNLDWKNRRMQELWNRMPDDFVVIAHRQKCPFIWNIPVKGEWAVESHRNYWQANLFLEFIANNKGCVLHTGKLSDWLINEHGILDWVIRLHELKQEQKKKGKASSKAYGEKGAWFFDDFENYAIPSPFAIVLSYLENLKMVGFLERSGKYSFTILFDNPDDYLSIVERKKVKQEEKRQQLFEQEQGRIKQLIEERSFLKTDEGNNPGREYYKQKLDQYIEIMIKADRRVLNEFQGMGVKCKKCQITRPEEESIVCPYCGEEESEPFLVTHEHLTSAHHKYRCSSKVGKAVKAVSLDYDQIINKIHGAI